jgi:hypothetical protein
MRVALNTKIVMIGLALGLAMLCASLVYIWIVQPAVPRQPVGDTAALTLIPAATSTPRVLPFTPSPFPPTAGPTHTPAPGEVAPGAYVQIVNTGGEGLRIRSEPGLDSTVIFSGFDAEVFLVSEGPVEEDGYTWWYLTASYDQKRAGWAVEDFLSAIENP